MINDVTSFGVSNQKSILFDKRKYSYFTDKHGVMVLKEKIYVQ